MIKNRVRMTLIGIFFGFSISSKLWSQTLDPSGPLGTSDPYLIKAGTSVVSILSSSLENPQNEPHFESLIDRLRTIDLDENQRSTVTRALTRFVGRNIQRKSDIGKTVFTICSALETIGMRGSDAEMDFLGDWLRSGKHSKTVRCYGGAIKNQKEAKDLFLACATRGLGFSGHPRGLQTLVDVEKSPPNPLWPKNLIGIIRESIHINRVTARKRQSSVLDAGRDSLKGSR